MAEVSITFDDCDEPGPPPLLNCAALLRYGKTQFSMLPISTEYVRCPHVIQTQSRYYLLHYELPLISSSLIALALGLPWRRRSQDCNYTSKAVTFVPSDVA